MLAIKPIPIILLILALVGFPLPGIANTFNRLVEEKAELEKEYGIQSLECFPFTRNIGDAGNQKKLILQCLDGARTLAKALAKIADAEFRMVGIGDKFMRTGGFHSALVPWNASAEEMAEFLSRRLPEKERQQFLDRIYFLKRSVAGKVRIGQLYCAMTVSNDQCLQGYENLAAALEMKSASNSDWREIVITDVHEPQENPHKLALKFDDPPVTMRQHLMEDVNRQWKSRKKTYEEIQSRFGAGFKERLKLENIFCDRDLTHEECLKGATGFYQASANESLQTGFWGRVTIHRYNTSITDDHNVSIRYDLPPEEIVSRLSRKPASKETTANIVLAEKLETRIKNNPTKLRAVCDLEGLASALCVKGFQTFIAFVRGDRDYRVKEPWSTLMFVDGSQLSRVNFALNSSARNTYIYVDADSGPEEFSSYMNRFRKQEAGPAGKGN